MKGSRLETAVGFFLVLGFCALSWLALQLGELSWFSSGRTYMLAAEFENVSGVKNGASVQVSGVQVGTVHTLSLTDEDRARVEMRLDKTVKVPVDSIASVKSQGIIGDKFIQLTLGSDESLYAPGEVIFDTESAVDLESLISKFAFGQVK
ncbi:MAG: outer membrane lipid asymmetry maintenance protein MlaD [Desulfobulbus propionicus]|nr:MAG: outer membrane lipid asymmetry maintenance protein MlaD [Desulfobulbus propionicus]